MLLPTGLGVPLPTAPLRTVSKRYCDQRESLLTRIVLGTVTFLRSTGRSGLNALTIAGGPREIALVYCRRPDIDPLTGAVPLTEPYKAQYLSVE